MGTLSARCIWNRTSCVVSVLLNISTLLLQIVVITWQQSQHQQRFLRCLLTGNYCLFKWWWCLRGRRRCRNVPHCFSKRQETCRIGAQEHRVQSWSQNIPVCMLCVMVKVWEANRKSGPLGTVVVQEEIRTVSYILPCLWRRSLLSVLTFFSANLTNPVLYFSCHSFGDWDFFSITRLRKNRGWC